MNKDMATFVERSVDEASKELVALSSDIWEHPEIGHEEFRTSGLLCDALERRGFAVERGIADMPTAFVARRGTGSPTVCFTAEYDALPEVGHACGHNLFCCSAVAGATAFAEWLESGGREGTALVIGGPAEEGGAVDDGGGKVPLVEQGFFDGVDVAMIAHADGSNVVERRLDAGATISVTFTGRPAHAGGSPERGINALTAATLLVTNINACRQQFEPLIRVNPVVRECSPSVNTIPQLCVVRLNMRAPTRAALDAVMAKVVDCITAAALVTGCSEEHHPVSNPTSDLVPNHALATAWADALDELGVIDRVDSDERGFCWDMGNVSHVVPTIAPYMKIGPEGLVGHTPEFRECANSELAHDAMLNAAKAMALTAGSYALDPELRRAAADEFASFLAAS